MNGMTDGMALLCTLHAGGPVTLRHLRRAGIRTLDDVLAADEEQLARVMNGPLSLAGRFAREAALLAERLGDDVLDPEDGPLLAAERLRHPLRTYELRPAPRGGPAAPPAPEPPPPAPERREVRAQPGTAAGKAREAIPAAPPRPLREPPLPEPEPARGLPGATLLSPSLVEGLRPSTCELLVGQGVRTLETLIESASLGLARRAGLSFPRLLELSFAARRLVRGSAPPRRAGRAPIPREAIAVLAGARAPAAARDPGAEGDAAGPFA